MTENAISDEESKRIDTLQCHTNILQGRSLRDSPNKGRRALDSVSCRARNVTDSTESPEKEWLSAGFRPTTMTGFERLLV